MSEFMLLPDDVREVIASILLSTLDQSKRMTLATGATLPPGFTPEKTEIPELDEIWAAITNFFGLSLKHPSGTITQWAEIIHTHWDNNGTITFSTSGSTGAPQQITHDYQLLIQEVQAFAKLLNDRRRIVSLVPPHHIYGFLFSVLLPKVMTVPVIREAPLPVPGLIDSLSPGDLVVAFPLLWNSILKQDATFGQDIHGVTSTGPCPPETIETLVHRGLSRMYEIYGSSETGGIGYRYSPRQEYTLLHYWDRTNNAHELTRTHPNRPPTVFSLQDTLAWNGDKFIPERRVDRCVQVAGINVSPDAVKNALLQHPDIKECTVRLMRPEEGERLKAFVVPVSTSSCDDLSGKLRKWAKANLPPHEVPGKITVGERLPINRMGKLSDW